MSFWKHLNLNRRTGQGATAAVFLAFAGIITAWEGSESTGYIDPVGIPTACQGHTGPEVKVGEYYSPAMCEAFLQEDFKVANDAVNRLVKVPLTTSEEAAYSSFVYNVGQGAFSTSTALRRLNRGDHEGACEAMGMWVYGTVDGKKVVLKGLQNRRADEIELCKSEL